MQEKDYIEKMFADKLGSAETPVNMELWSSIASKIPSATAATTTATVKGLSVAAKWLIGLGVAACISAGAYFIIDNGSPANNTVADKGKVDDKIESINQEDKNNKENLYHTDYSVPPQVIDLKEKPTQSSEKIVGPFSCDSYKLVGSWHCQCGSWPLCSHDQKDSSFMLKPENEIVEPNVVSPIIRRVDNGGKTIYENNPEQVVENTGLVSSFKVKPLPNAFTINNDGANDHFYLEMEGINDFVLTILDDKNRVIYSTSDTNFKWDGRDSSGNYVTAGKYLYFFTGKDEQGKAVTQSSTLSIFIK